MRRSAVRPAGPGTGFIDPKVLGRIHNLELLARTVVDGFISGLHRAPFLGLSVDFAEHRQYMPGDDIRRIDWRLYARSDRFYLKHFEADSNSNFMVILDTSRSMSFQQEGISKLDYGRYLAACLSYFSRQQRDRVGLVTIAGEIVDYVPPAAGHLDIVLHTIDRIKAGGAGTLAEPLHQLTGRIGRRGIMVVISDFYEEPQAVVDAVKDLRYAGHDVIVFHLLDPAELDFPFEKPASFQDLETTARLPVVPGRLREGYRELIRDHTETLSRRFVEHRIDYGLFNTGTPLDYALFSYLSARQRLMRVR
jgi:uncharacterized protein (DUF58 family)